MVEEGPFTLAAMVLLATFTFLSAVPVTAATMLPTAVVVFYCWKKRPKAKLLTLLILLLPTGRSLCTVAFAASMRHTSGMNWVVLADSTSYAWCLRTGFRRWLSRTRGVRRHPIVVLLENLLPLCLMLWSNIRCTLYKSLVKSMLVGVYGYGCIFVMTDIIGIIICSAYIDVLESLGQWILDRIKSASEKENIGWSHVVYFVFISACNELAEMCTLVQGNNFRTELWSLVSDSYQEESRCSICFERYWEGDRRRLLVRCGHMFHVDCIDRWLRRTKWCPLCRTRATRKYSPYSSNAFGSNWWSRQHLVNHLGFFP